jgi:hypothetical protein
MERHTELWTSLLEYARWTPSPHNIQSWRISCESAHQATLYYDPTRLIPDTDPHGQFATIGFGIFLEYLRIAASHAGYTLTWTPLCERVDPAVSAPTPFFALELQEGATPDTLPLQLIQSRQTSRLAYDNSRPITTSALEDLRIVAQEFGHDFTFSTKKAMVSWLLHLNADTLFYDMDEPLTRSEVRRWLRYSEREAEHRKDGLSARCMRMPGWLMRIFFEHHALLTVPLIRKIVWLYYRRSMQGTSTVAWMAGKMSNTADWIRAGQMLGRFWLVMAKENIYLHPFGSVITNPMAHGRLSEKIAYGESNQSEKSSAPLWMVMRLGYSDTPPQSKRLATADILYEK